MAGTDQFSNMAFDPTMWSDDVTYDSGTGAIVVNSVGSGDATLDGTARAMGDLLNFSYFSGSFTLASDVEVQFDVDGGTVVLSGGDYWAFFSRPMQLGASYPAVAGFGHFNDAPGDPACFVSGTRIATPRGEVPIDDLRPGDLVLSAAGRVPVDVIWVGRRKVRCDLHPNPAEVRPVRVEAGALAPGIPARDLFLSPDHALSLDGALVPVRYLVNGASIRRVAFAAVTYHHLELARHGTVLAEGAAAESYLDTGNRAGFDQDRDVRPRAWPKPAAARPTVHHALLTGGPRLEELRRRLLHRAHALGHVLTADPALTLLADDRPIALTVAGPTYRGEIPAGTRLLSLHSRTACPIETAPASADHRRLGLCVVALRIAGLPVGLDHAMLEAGWHDTEGGLRWTAGAARILPPRSDRPQEICVMTSGELRYWTEAVDAGPIRTNGRAHDRAHGRAHGRAHAIA